MTLISVIIPTYNAQSYLSDAVTSVLKQTFKDFEIIIVDDSSTDDSLATAMELSRQHERIAVISHAFRKGVSAARNTGIENARGKYCAFLDADDMWVSAKLATHVKIMNAHPEIGFTYDCSSFIDERGELIGLNQVPSKFKNITPEYMLLRCPVGNGSSAVILTKVLKNMRFNETLHHMEDLELWVRFVLQANMQIFGIKQLLTLYRIRENSASSNMNKHIKAFADVLKAINSYAPELIKKNGSLAYAYQLRYVARRAVMDAQPAMGLRYLVKSFFTNYKIVIQEPARTISTLIMSVCMLPIPKKYYGNTIRFLIKASNSI